MDPARISALLHAAALLAPADLVIDVHGDCKDHAIPIEIPSFQRVTSIKLHVANLKACSVPYAGTIVCRPLALRQHEHG
jgi:hypothetical protein